MKQKLPEISQNEVFILDSQISSPLDAREAPKNLIAWFSFCEPIARIIIFPYNSRDVNGIICIYHLCLLLTYGLFARGHWSLVVIDMSENVVLYCNSLAGTTHLDIKK